MSTEGCNKQSGPAKRGREFFWRAKEKNGSIQTSAHLQGNLRSVVADHGGDKGFSARVQVHVGPETEGRSHRSCPLHLSRQQRGGSRALYREYSGEDTAYRGYAAFMPRHARFDARALCGFIGNDRQPRAAGARLAQKFGEEEAGTGLSQGLARCAHSSRIAAVGGLPSTQVEAKESPKSLFAKTRGRRS